LKEAHALFAIVLLDSIPSPPSAYICRVSCYTESRKTKREDKEGALKADDGWQVGAK
jgi:hypothetical protein